VARAKSVDRAHICLAKINVSSVAHFLSRAQYRKLEICDKIEG
jgi:hypothetical protein